MQQEGREVKTPFGPCRLKCEWCGCVDVRVTKEGCYGGYVHVICKRKGCGHEWDIVVCDDDLWPKEPDVRTPNH